jgi:hypothetical protein
MVAVVVEEQREREGSGRVASGYSLLFDAKQIGQGERVFQDPSTPERDLQQILFSPFGRLEREGKERGRRD